MKTHKRKYTFYIGIFLLFLLFYFLSYHMHALRYNDKDIVVLEAYKEENNYLKELIKDREEIKELDKTHSIAYVLNRDLYHFYDEVTINTTEVSIGDAVLNGEGLIGIITKINKKDSTVSLLSGDIKVSVKINNTYGILKNGIVTMLDKYEIIEKGCPVYTSGLTTIPENIFIGTVENVYTTKDNLNQEASISLINNDVLNYVAVLRGEV